jgi:hypothetical protein
MTNMLISSNWWGAYLLPSAVSVAVFYLLYKGWVRNDNHFQSRRFLILGFLAFSIALPFLHIQLPVNVTESEVGAFYRNMISVSEQMPVGLNTEPAVVVAEHSKTVSLLEIIGWTYGIVVLFLFGRLCAGILRLVLFFRNGKRIPTKDATIIVSSQISTAFSFFRWIFMPEPWYNSNERNIMLCHECVHINQKHTWDLMAMEMLCVVQFFNPFAWLLKHEMRLNHEFLADRGTFKNGEDATQYFQLLLQKKMTKQPILVHSFHYSPLKNRIMMQLQKPAKMLSHARYLLFIPVALALMAFFACRENSKTSQNAKSSMYLYLNAEQLKPLGVELSEKGLLYQNYNATWKEDHQRSPCLALYCTATSSMSNIVYDDVQELNDHPIFKDRTTTHLDFYPKLVANSRGHFGIDRSDRGTEKLLPVAVCMAETKIANRTDTLILWFKPTESLQKALPKGIAMEDYVKFPDARE